MRLMPPPNPPENRFLRPMTSHSDCTHCCFTRSLLLVAAAVCMISLASPRNAAARDADSAPPSKGQSAKDFQLSAASGTLEGQVKLSEVAKEGPVVLVVLRGFPGYQCGICSRQVGKWVSQAKAFQEKGVNVLMVYPGPDNGLDGRAKEFLRGSSLPKPFTLLVDPDYGFTNAYGLRWNAPRETAYPSTFIIDRDGKIQFAKVSKSHGGRTDPSEVLGRL